MYLGKGRREEEEAPVKYDDASASHLSRGKKGKKKRGDGEILDPERSIDPPPSLFPIFLGGEKRMRKSVSEEITSLLKLLS